MKTLPRRQTVYEVIIDEEVPPTRPFALYVNEVPTVFAVIKKNPSARSAVRSEFVRPVMLMTEATGGGVVVKTVMTDGVAWLDWTSVTTKSVPGIS